MKKIDKVTLKELFEKKQQIDLANAEFSTMLARAFAKVGAPIENSILCLTPIGDGELCDEVRPRTVQRCPACIGRESEQAEQQNRKARRAAQAKARRR